MDSKEFLKLLTKDFPHQPTVKQAILLVKLSEFVFSKDSKSVFLLKGYAGTGKTTTISTLVNNLRKALKKSILLAPTGRAAKVISAYSGQTAYTIHKKIYYSKQDKSGNLSFKLQKNKHTNTVFIIDEASMIPDNPSDAKLFENGSLLDDLIYYINEGHNCKAIFIGDTAQLPPVNLDVSPALSPEKLMLNYDKEVIEIELDEVVRQTLDSGILYNATALREKINFLDTNEFKFNVSGFTDIIRLIDGHDIQDAINTAYENNGVEDTAILVYSNKRANIFNQQIRSRILYHEHELTVGDLMMVVKNNYYWLDETDVASFIANGDIVEILEIYNFKELYEFKFASVRVRMIDYPDQKPFDTVMLLDTIHSEKPSLSYEDSGRLYQEVLKDYTNLPKYRQYQAIKKNKYFNALQVKFSYSVTCHKSQGGQWKSVFVEKPYLPNGINKSYLRWLYTAITRAQEKLYLIGFNDNDFEE